MTEEDKKDDNTNQLTAENEVKLHLNQSARPRITETVAFVVSPPAATQPSRRASPAQNPDKVDVNDLDNFMNELETSFGADNDGLSDDSDDEASHGNLKVTLETKPSDTHAKIDESNAPNAMQTENDTEVQPTSENPDSNRSEIPHTQQKFQKKNSTSDPPGRWTNQGNSPSRGKGAKGKGEGKGSRKAPQVEIDFLDQQVIESPILADLINVSFALAPADLSNFILDPDPKESRKPDGSLKTDEYRIASLSPLGWGAQGVLSAIQVHAQDVVKLHTGITRTKGNPKPPWNLQTQIAQEERANFNLYLEILHTQNHIITLNIKDENGNKRKID